MTSIPQLKSIIEAPLADLLEWQRSAPFELTSDDGVYISTLISYLQSDIRGLLGSIDCLHRLDSSLVHIAELRLKIRQQNVSRLQIRDHFEALSLRTTSSEHLGEMGFVAGFASWMIGDYEGAISYYTEARKNLLACGSLKKALKISQNILATKTCIDAHLKCIPEYNQIFLEARKLRDHATCGLTMLNISREYQKIGALNLALKTINIAITHFKKEHGTLHYYMARAHRAHVLIQLNNYQTAVLDIEECLTSNFPEVHGAIKVLESIETQNKFAEQPHLLNPTWTARASRLADEKSPETRLHDLEERLLAILRNGPKAKVDLVHELYGTKIDYESAENRFKNLLVRIRKKKPDLICLEKNHYKIRDGRMNA